MAFLWLCVARKKLQVSHLRLSDMYWQKCFSVRHDEERRDFASLSLADDELIQKRTQNIVCPLGKVDWHSRKLTLDPHGAHSAIVFDALGAPQDDDREYILWHEFIVMCTMLD